MSSAVEPIRNSLLRTPLHSLHEELGARMVPFAGFEMPLQYPAGIKQEHLHTRRGAGLFDVSHMGQIRIHGDDAPARLETLVPSDMVGLAPRCQRYTVFTNDAGGVIDDLMVTRLPDCLFLVVNAAGRNADLEHLRRHLGAACTPVGEADRALLALQGPAAAMVLSELAPAVTGLRFLQSGDFMLDGIPCLVNRCGYTGEDGFEISLPADAAVTLARRLLQHEQVEPVGLGARDSLRLEAGLCLYGHDLDTVTTPVEANLGWVVARKYRDGVPACFPAAARILAEIEHGTTRRRVGLRPTGPPVREGCELLDGTGRIAGHVTSGGFGPTLGAPVAMGYVDMQYAVPGTRLQAEIRGRTHAVEVCEMPFIRTRYRH